MHQATLVTVFKLPDIFEYLTGQTCHDDENPQSKSALSANGICIIFDIFLDLDVPPLEINTIQVIPGYIEFEDSQCGTAIDIVNRSKGRRLPSLQYDEKDFSYNMVVQQKVHDTDIGVGYELCVEGGGVDLGGLCWILSNVMQKITLFNCTTWCQADKHETDKRFPGQKATASDKTSINDQWVAVVLTRTDKYPLAMTTTIHSRLLDVAILVCIWMSSGIGQVAGHAWSESTTVPKACSCMQPKPCLIL
jgi:hypothetical protein